MALTITAVDQQGLSWLEDAGIRPYEYLVRPAAALTPVNERNYGHFLAKENWRMVRGRAMHHAHEADLTVAQAFASLKGATDLRAPVLIGPHFFYPSGWQCRGLGIWIKV